MVEDDIQIQNFMVYTLENAGFEAFAVPSGKEVIECMIRKDIDLILLDLGHYLLCSGLFQHPVRVAGDDRFSPSAGLCGIRREQVFL